MYIVVCVKKAMSFIILILGLSFTSITCYNECTSALTKVYNLDIKRAIRTHWLNQLTVVVFTYREDVEVVKLY